MTGQTIILRGEAQRERAKRLIDAAPIDAVVTISEAKRSNDQSSLMWSLLSDISRFKPGGRRLTADQWKSCMLQACGYEVQFLNGIDGHPFPVGFRSSRLTKKEMSDLIDFITAWGAEQGVQWSTPAEYTHA